MLVLTRAPGERIVLPGLGVTIEVIEFRGNKVRIGIEAPRDIAVHREELWREIERSRSTAITREHRAAETPK